MTRCCHSACGPLSGQDGHVCINADHAAAESDIANDGKERGNGPNRAG